MKKTIAAVLALTMLLSLAACRRKTDTTPTDDSGENKDALSGTMQENVDKLIQANPVQFMGGHMPVDLQDTSEEGLWALKSYTGLDSGNDLTDVAVYEPMTGSQAFSLVMVRLDDGVDAKTVARQMKENINPRKWICAGADQVMAAGYGDVVMFIMVDSTLGLTAQSYVDAFATLCGGKTDFTI